MEVRISAASVLVLVATLAACSSSGTSPSSTSDGSPADSSTTSVPETTTGGGTTGMVTVVIGGDTLEFTATVCTLTDDVLNVEATGEAGALTIRHASPPTRRPPEPSFAVFRIEGDLRYEAPPAAVQLDTYEPAAGVAAGEALDVMVDGDPSAPRTASFTIECPSNV
jgi:pectate lyase